MTSTTTTDYYPQQVAADIASLGGIEMLVDAGARHPEDQTVQARVAGALWGLSVHDEIAELIGEMGGDDARRKRRADVARAPPAAASGPSS